ncbi:hypothetical protein L3073_09035 [Ancylomarina sp. DW003]|nr:hypothetical protein [Ancylomarina sp. DW003]MDE5422347.1 hypothetical protein [Ancylomarina sp. DW003]
MINKNIWLYLLIVFGLSSCTTYYIPIYSFKEQVKDIDSTELRTVYTRGPMGNIVEYKTYPIDYIKCVDKNNNPTELKNGPSIEIRFTEKNNKRTIFYFDQIYIKDSMVIGDRSRFIQYKKTIFIDSLKLIEVQDGKKNFKYVNKKK